MKVGIETTQRLEGAMSVAQMTLYGVFGRGQDIDSRAVVAAVSELKVDRLELYFNSVGGDPMDGFAIANRLSKMQQDGQIGELHTFGEGVVGSAATIPFLAGSERSMYNGSRFFIHKGSATLHISGTEETLPNDERLAAMFHEFRNDLVKTNREAAELYEARSTLSAAEIDAAMDASTSYSPREAVEVGFATQRHAAHAIAACWDTDRVMAFLPDIDRKAVEKLQVIAFEDDPVSQEYASLIRPENWQSMSQSDIDKALRLK